MSIASLIFKFLDIPKLWARPGNCNMPVLTMTKFFPKFSASNSTFFSIIFVIFATITRERVPNAIPKIERKVLSLCIKRLRNERKKLSFIFFHIFKTLLLLQGQAQMLF